MREIWNHLKVQTPLNKLKYFSPFKEQNKIEFSSLFIYNS